MVLGEALLYLLLNLLFEEFETISNTGTHLFLSPSLLMFFFQKQKMAGSASPKTIGFRQGSFP